MQRRPSEHRPKHGPVERLTDKADAAKPYSPAAGIGRPGAKPLPATLLPLPALLSPLRDAWIPGRLDAQR